MRGKNLWLCGSFLVQNSIMPRQSPRAKSLLPVDSARPSSAMMLKRQLASSSDSLAKKNPKVSTVDDLQSEIIANLHKHSTQTTKDWFTNYVKGTEWIGCKLPTVRLCVNAVIPPVKKTKRKKNKKKEDEHADLSSPALSAELLLDTSIRLMEQKESDVKLAGMLILSECFPVDDPSLPLCSVAVLDRLEKSVLDKNFVGDWSSADWFAMKVLRKIALEAPEDQSEEIVQRVLDYTKNGTNLWYRRCGVVPFVQYYKNRDVLPNDMDKRVIHACEESLLASPNERFTQTGIAWVLRYMVSPETATKQERKLAGDMILKHSDLWTKEARKSLTEKLTKTDPLARKILKA